MKLDSENNCCCWSSGFRRSNMIALPASIMASKGNFRLKSFHWHRPFIIPHRCKSWWCCRSETSKGDAVINYREPLVTKEMRYPQLSWRVKNMTIFIPFLDATTDRFQKLKPIISKPLLLFFLNLSWHVFYATGGFILNFRVSPTRMVTCLYQTI